MLSPRLSFPLTTAQAAVPGLHHHEPQEEGRDPRHVLEVVLRGSLHSEERRVELLVSELEQEAALPGPAAADGVLAADRLVPHKPLGEGRDPCHVLELVLQVSLPLAPQLPHEAEELAQAEALSLLP